MLHEESLPFVSACHPASSSWNTARLLSVFGVAAHRVVAHWHIPSGRHARIRFAILARFTSSAIQFSCSASNRVLHVCVCFFRKDTKDQTGMQMLSDTRFTKEGAAPLYSKGPSADREPQRGRRKRVTTTRNGETLWQNEDENNCANRQDVCIACSSHAQAKLCPSSQTHCSHLDFMTTGSTHLSLHLRQRVSSTVQECDKTQVCRMTKTTRVRFQKRPLMRANGISHASSIGDSIAADHKILN